MSYPFSFFEPPISNCIPSGELSLEEVYQKITSDEELRRMNEKVVQGIAFKGAVLSYITCNTFTYRSSLFPKDYFGFIHADIDGKDNPGMVPEELKRLLAEDPDLNPPLAYTSPRHNGLKVFFRVEGGKAEEHGDYFDALASIMLRRYNIIIDAACRDLARASWLAHDPNCWCNPLGFIPREKLLSFLPVRTTPPVDAIVPVPNYVSSSTAVPAFGTPLYTSGERPSSRLNRLEIIHTMAETALKNAGWKFKGDLLCRPGKEFRQGCSGIYNIYEKEQIWIMTCFSSNAFPFMAHRAYTDCQILCLLNYRNDWKSCITDLASRFLGPL